MHVNWLSTSPACDNSGDDAGHPYSILGYLSKVGGPNMAPLIHMRKGTQNATGIGTGTSEHDTHDHYFAVGDADEANAPTGGYSVYEMLGYAMVPSPPGTHDGANWVPKISTGSFGAGDIDLIGPMLTLVANSPPGSGGHLQGSKA